MIARRLLVMLVALSLLVVLGCGKKDTTTVDSTDIDPPPVEEPDEAPVTDPEPDIQEIDTTPEVEDVFFDFDKYNLSTESKRTLERNATEMKRSNKATLVIEGHCDERGTKSYNLALGEKRAKAAKNYLVSLGVSSSRLTTISYGKERPFSSGHSEDSWAKNRRAHMVAKK